MQGHKMRSSLTSCNYPLHIHLQKLKGYFYQAVEHVDYTLFQKIEGTLIS